MATVKDKEPEKTTDDINCPICGKERALLVKRSEGGMPARCCMYHPGYDTPGIRRFSPSGMAWLVDAGGIRRRDYENDIINRRIGTSE
jgi:hypothetical protein